MAVFTDKNRIFGGIEHRFLPYDGEYFDYTANFSLNFDVFGLDTRNCHWKFKFGGLVLWA